MIVISAEMNNSKLIFLGFICKFKWRRSCVPLFLLVCLVCPIRSFCDWHVKDAPLRYELRLDKPPTHSSAGYFVCVPDGGILPGPVPVVHVVTSEGHPVEAFTLWHNPESSMALVFADPGVAGELVFVYFVGAQDYNLWSPATGITPSAILASDPGVSSMADAKALASFGRVRRGVCCWNHAGEPQAPLSIGGDLAGRPRPGVFYLLAYLEPQDPGRTWIAPFTLYGETEVSINGEVIVPTKRIDKWGGIGQWVELDYGLHRLEVFQTAPGTGEYFTLQSRALMFLTWRTPNATMEELGGVRSDAVPMPGTSKMETRVLRDDEIVRSGAASIEAASSSDGSPVAFIVAEPTHTFWAENETPLLLYTLRALESGNPPDTEYRWLFGDGAEASGAVIYWLMPAFTEHKITLTASSQAAMSEMTSFVFAFGHVQTSYSNPQHRKAYRDAFLQLLISYEEKPDKIAALDVAYWNNLLRCMEFGGGYDLLSQLFRNYRNAMLSRLSPEQIIAFEEMFLDAASPVNPAEALDWTAKFQEGPGVDPDRRKHLTIRGAEIRAWYMDDLEGAKRMLVPLARGGDQAGQLARIRLGDIAFMEGDLNLATRYYADVQNQARHEREMFTGVYDALGAGASKEPVAVADEQPHPQTTADKLRADREAFMKAAQQHRERFAESVRTSQVGDAARPASPWKLNSLLDASASDNVRELVKNGFWFEARQALDAWEMELPLSKIGGDYILQESRLYHESGNPKRAYKMLKAYCDQVDASSYLPASAKLLIQCMKSLNMDPEEIISYGRKLKARLEFHPVAEEIDIILGSEE